MKQTYNDELGRHYTMDQVRNMTDADLMGTLAPDTKAFFQSQPIQLLQSFKAHILGDEAECKRLRDEAVKIQGLPETERKLDEITKQKGLPTSGLMKDILNTIEKIQDLINGTSGGSSMSSFSDPTTPEENAQYEVFKEKGVTIHFSLDEYRTLLEIIDDAHHNILNEEEAAEELRQKQGFTPKQEEAHKDLTRRHENLHEFSETLGDKFEAVYPLLHPSDEPTKH